MTVPREELVRLHASSGTHGKPTVVGYTRADLDNWTELMARCMTIAGVRPGMVIHNANSYGLFTGGPRLPSGRRADRRDGAPGVGRLQRAAGDAAARPRRPGAGATPSYALVIAQAVRDAGIELSELRLEIGLFGGEPWSEAMRDADRGGAGPGAMNFYGLSEMCGPGVAAECATARAGLHVQEDHFLVEVIDPDSGEPCPRARRASSCSPRCSRRRCRCCATGPATSGRSRSSPAPAGARWPA